MSIQYEDLVDPRETFLESGPPAYEPAPKEEDPKLVLIGVGIAAAIVGIKMYMTHRLMQESPKSPSDARSMAAALWGTGRRVWRQLAVPSIVAAYRAGVTGLTVTPDVLEKLAVLYADELGDYIFQTSTEAMVEGFSAQLNNGMNTDTSWIRSTAGYGLDSKQTRQYIVTLQEHVKGQYVTEPIPEASIQSIDRMMLTRADRIGQNEAYKATQMGRNMVWSYMENEGELTNARKRWITAEDERVCPVCAPLDGVAIPFAQPFESAGQQFYAPGVHPNCRCEIVLDNSINIVKAMSGDPFDRDRRGRFSSIELRTAKTLPPIGQNYTPIGASLAPIGSMMTGIGFARAPIGQTLPPIAEARQPVATELPPIGQAEMFFAPKAKPPQAKIGQGKPKISSKTLTDSKVKTKIKNTVKTQLDSEVANPARVKVQSKTESALPSDIEFHGRPLIVPASRYISNAHMNAKHFYDPETEGSFIYFDGDFDLTGFIGESTQGLENSNANLQAFNQEMDDLLPVDLPHDKEIRYEFITEAGGEGSASLEPDKSPLRFFVFERGWKGNVEQESEQDHPGWGVPIGWYRVDRVKHVNAARSDDIYPETIRDQIDAGIHPNNLTDIPAAAEKVSGIVTINLVPVSQDEVDQTKILKRAPRLILRRK
jgi:hypothetical protein